MLKYIVAMALILLSANVSADTAKWTGKFEQLEQEKLGVGLWACYYVKDSKEYIRVMEDYCLLSIEVKENNSQGSKGNLALNQ